MLHSQIHCGGFDFFFISTKAFLRLKWGNACSLLFWALISFLYCPEIVFCCRLTFLACSLCYSPNSHCSCITFKCKVVCLKTPTALYWFSILLVRNTDTRKCSCLYSRYWLAYGKVTERKSRSWEMKAIVGRKVPLFAEGFGEARSGLIKKKK